MKIMTFKSIAGNMGDFHLKYIFIMPITVLMDPFNPQFYHLLTYKLGPKLRHYIFQEKLIF